jgi:preprotein translocase subunit SecD
MLCANESILEFRIAHNEDKPNTEVVIDKYVGKFYSEKIPFLTLPDISKVNLIVDDSKPPVWIEQAGESAGMTIIQPQIILEVILKKSGKTTLAQVTSENIKKRIAVFIDGEFIMAPVIIDRIDSDRFLISGNFKEKEGKDIVDRINESLNKKK